MKTATYTGEVLEIKDMEYFSAEYIETEKKLVSPFANTNINRFLALLDHCCGDKDYVDMETLRLVFEPSSMEWINLCNLESILYKALNSHLFKRFPNDRDDDRIDKVSL